jgi:WD40 repeat protein
LSICVSPTGNKIVTASRDKTLKVLLMWKSIWSLLLLLLLCLCGFDFGLILLQIWDANSGLELHTLVGHTSNVLACDVSLEDRWIVSASRDGTFKVWLNLHLHLHLNLIVLFCCCTDVGL